MDNSVALIGFGEAGSTFAEAGAWEQAARVFDIKTDDPSAGKAKRADYAAAGVRGCDTLAEAVSGAALVLSLVTADHAPKVARQAATLMDPGALFCDLNSVAPPTKRAAAQAIEAAGGRYVDVAVMAPVHPARLNVPLLLSGAGADEAAQMLAQLGFANLRVVGDHVGRASSIKMIRSVMVKGMEALTAECVLAAEAAGVLDEVLASLDASEKPRPWADRADYNLDRMLVHGIRRAAEMEEVVKTLEALGTGALLTRGTVARQQALGTLGLSPPEGLAAKIEAIQNTKNREA
jgi:3-hydroxyisobutyrate dehydrogenase-like beta-hydroxyacid dehydrogenase